MNLDVREESLADVRGVRRVTELAFGRPDEAGLVDCLRARGGTRLSLVALLDYRLVGHAVFSTVVVDDATEPVEGVGLGPLSVLPEVQRTGVGSQLVVEGVRRLRAQRHPFVAVVGDPDYFLRFGFVPARRHGVRCARDVADEAFQLLVLDAARLRGISGVAHYCTEFGGLA